MNLTEMFPWFAVQIIAWIAIDIAESRKRYPIIELICDGGKFYE